VLNSLPTRGSEEAIVLDTQPNVRAKNFDEFCGQIGNLYVRAGLSPPFQLREHAERWLADGISPSHCIEQIRLDLERYGRSITSGSGDRHLLFVHSIIRRTWFESQYPRTDCAISDQLTEGENSVDPADQVVDESPDDRVNTQWPPAPVPRKPVQSENDRARAFLLRELADGEMATNELNGRAKAARIAERTLERARKNLEVVSRRTGFGQTGQHWVSLPKPRNED
jgi:hypothetical protein